MHILVQRLCQGEHIWLTCWFNFWVSQPVTPYPAKVWFSVSAGNSRTLSKIVSHDTPKQDAPCEASCEASSQEATTKVLSQTHARKQLVQSVVQDLGGLSRVSGLSASGLPLCVTVVAPALPLVSGLCAACFVQSTM